MPDAALGTSYVFITVNPHTCGGGHHYPRFTDEENEAHGDYVACPRSPSLENAECLTQCSSPSCHAAHEGAWQEGLGPSDNS